MKNYKNLTVIVDANQENRIHYNLDNGQATIFAKTEADITRGIKDLEQRGVLVQEMGELI